MDNITYVVNPYQNNVINSEGVVHSAKAAKLNNTIKRPTLVANYAKELSKMVQSNTFNQPVEVKKESEPVATSTVYTEIAYPSEAVSNGARKLKVTHFVVQKTQKKYKLSSGNIPKVEEKAPLMEPVVKMPIKEENIAMPSFNPVVEERKETRLERLQRTGEIPIVHDDKPNTVNGVINTPARFGGESNILYEAAHALVDDEPVVTDTPKLEIGEEGKKLDLINQVSHGENGYDDILSQKNRIEEETSEVLRQNSELENKIMSMEQILAETERRVKEKELSLKKKELEKAKSAYKQASEDNNSMTNTFKDLASKIRELQMREAQIDKLNGDEYSRSMGRAA